MAGRILANLIVMGSGVVLRAASQAYRQAIINGAKAGVTAENAGKATNMGRAATMSVEEARQILGVEPNTPPEEVMKRFQHLWEVNDKHGSFYIMSKVYRAMEAIDPQVADMAQKDFEARKTQEHLDKMKAGADRPKEESEKEQQQVK